MPQLPANNLKERMLKLGYDPQLVKLVPPKLDNSAVKKKEITKLSSGVTSIPTKVPTEFINIDDWSDFEDE